MADNVTIPTTGQGTATPVIATDDVGGVHFQKIKPAYLTAGSNIVMKQAVGYIQGTCNIIPMIKPNSPAATVCADRFAVSRLRTEGQNMIRSMSAAKLKRRRKYA